MSLFARSNHTASQKTTLSLTALEARDVPAQLNLTHRGDAGTFGGVLFRQLETPLPPSALDSFLRLQDNSPRGGEEGYNTNARPLQFDSEGSRRVTHAIKVEDLPLVTIGGVQYREVILDINEGVRSQISLDELRIYVSDNPNLRNYNTRTDRLGGLQPVYDMDANRDNWVRLDASLNNGRSSGWGWGWGGGWGWGWSWSPNRVGDMAVDIPVSLLPDTDAYFTLYSKFGTTIRANGGYEEWSIRVDQPPAPLPAPEPESAPPASAPPAASPTIAGILYRDDMQDGQLGGGDTQLSGWTLQLVVNGVVVSSATSAADGSYSFDVPEGTTDFTILVFGPGADPTLDFPATYVDGVLNPGESLALDIGYDPEG